MLDNRIIFIIEYKSARMADSMPGWRMLTRSGVDENTILCSGLTNKTKAKVALSVDITVLSQSDVYTVEEKQTIFNEDNQETNGQHPVSSKQQVGELLIVPSEFDDTAELNIDVNDMTTSNQSIVMNYLLINLHLAVTKKMMSY